MDQCGLTRAIAFVVMLASAGSCAVASDARVDGVPNEWSSADLLPAAAGGSSGVFNVTSVSARSSGTTLFLRFNTGVVKNLQAGSGSDGALLVDIRRTVPSEQSALTIDLRNKRLWLNGNTSSTIGWDVASFEVLPTYAASEFEMTVDLASAGFQDGDEIAVTFGDGNSGEDAATFTLDDASTLPGLRAYDQPPHTRLRIASVNTLQTGLLNGSQAPKLSRLIDAMDADVYCFQEEYNSSANQIKSLLQSIDPLGNGATWNVHKNNDCVVASHYPLVPLPSLNTKYAAAVVDLGGGEGVILFSIHPKCCGYIGSSEDNQRITETQTMINALNQVRAGTAGASLIPFADAPAMVIGDWNLVGSAGPLDLFTDPAGPDMRDAYIAPLAGDSFATWAGSASPGSFFPGRLDLMTVQRDALSVMNAFTLDTAKLDGSTLAALGLVAGDSAGSDHVMVVADLAFPGDLCGGDVDGSGSVDIFDFADLATRFGLGPGATRSEGDLTGDGYVDVFDFAALAGAFGNVCP